MSTFVYPDAIGGAERYIHGLARAQAASGHQVTVLTGDSGGHAAEERLDGLRIRRYPLSRRRGLGFYRDVQSAVSAALRSLASEGFDILHAHQIASAVPALTASFPARRVLGFHASHQLEFEAERRPAPEAGAASRLRLPDQVKAWAIRWLDQRCLQRAERIVVLTEFVRGQVARLAPRELSKVRVIPPGIEFDRFAPGVRAEARHRLEAPSDTFLIVTVRRLVRRMGIDLLLRAASLLAARGVPFLLAIGGTGGDRTRLESLGRELRIADRIRFLGRVPDDELPEWLRAADLVVVPSLAMEGFGISTAEALACGTPVVATDLGGNPEVLADLDPSLLVPPEPEALADRLEWLLRDPARRLELGARAAHYARHRYSWPSSVERVNQVYGELLGELAASSTSP